jgi:Recombination endonuclease VII
MSRWNSSSGGKEYYKNWVRKNKAHVKRYRRKYYDENIRVIKQRASDFSRKKLYGVTPEQFEEMKKKQNNRCFICGNPPPTDKNLGVDHNHETQEVRVLLCAGCNWMAGRLEKLGWKKLKKYFEMYLIPKGKGATNEEAISERNPSA